MQEEVNSRHGHFLPPSLGICRMVRVRVLMPMPQDLVHAVNSVQGPAMQSTGQEAGLHTRDSAVGHSSPPCIAVRLTTCVLVCLPAPQLLVHLDQALHLPMQSCGHGWLLQLICSRIDEQALPWCRGCTNTERERT